MSEGRGGSPVDVQRAFAITGGLALVSTFILPFAEIVNSELVGAGTSSLPGHEAGSAPLVLLGLGVLVLALSGIRWQVFTQVPVGLCGLLAMLATLVGRAWLASDTAGLRVGVHEGPATAFEPGIGTLVAFVGSALVVAGGLGAVLEYALTALRSDE